MESARELWGADGGAGAASIEICSELYYLAAMQPLGLQCGARLCAYAEIVRENPEFPLERMVKCRFGAADCPESLF